MSHKISAIDAKTGQLAGEIVLGRHVKAQTQQTPKDTVAAAITQTGGQPNSSEGKVEEATQIDPKFEALAKKEAAFRSKEREFQAREASYKEKESKLAAAEAFQTRLKESPLDVLNELGITYDQLVEQAINAPSSESREIKNELKSLRETQAKLIEDAKKSSDTQRESAVKQIRYDVQDLIESDPQFEITKATGSIDDVVELITRTFDETGRLMTVEQAAKKVEDELALEADKILSIGKIRAKFKPDLTEAVTQAKQQTSQQQQMTTLTNNMSSTRPLSARERAIKRFKGETF